MRLSIASPDPATSRRSALLKEAQKPRAAAQVSDDRLQNPAQRGPKKPLVINTDASRMMPRYFSFRSQNGHRRQRSLRSAFDP
jgi:hypothetical protein